MSDPGLYFLKVALFDKNLPEYQSSQTDVGKRPEPKEINKVRKCIF